MIGRAESASRFAVALLPVAAATAVVLVADRPASNPATDGSGPPEPVTRLVGADASACAAFPRADGSAAGVVAAMDSAGNWRTETLPPGATEPVLGPGGSRTGSGMAAPAAFTAQRLPEGDGGGLAVRQCDGPARQWWFVGAGSSTLRESTLVLTNVDASDAVVDVVLGGTGGPLDAVGADGVRVGAGETVRLPLGGLVAGEEEVSAAVVASQGRVVAAVADEWSGGLVPLGSEWIPATAAPATRVLLAGVAVDGPRSLLVVANASQVATPVNLSVVDDRGTFVPTEGDTELDVPAGGVASVRLPADVRGTGPGSSALVVEAEQPITASVRSRTGTATGTSADIAYGVAGPELAEPAVVPVDLGRSLAGARLALQLAAGLPGQAGPVPAARRVTVTGHAADGAVTGTDTVDITPGTAQLVDLAELDLTGAAPQSTRYLVLRPDAGSDRAPAPLVGTVVLRAAGSVAALPLDAGLTRVPVPALAPAVVPGVPLG